MRRVCLSCGLSHDDDAASDAHADQSREEGGVDWELAPFCVVDCGGLPALCRRSSEDERQVRICLTQRGRIAREKRFGFLDGLVNATGLAPARYQQLLEALVKLRENLSDQRTEHRPVAQNASAEPATRGLA